MLHSYDVLLTFFFFFFLLLLSSNSDSYRWLLQVANVSPHNIIFMGDSAGGGLVLSVLGAAKAEGLPLPAGGILWSPWVDLTGDYFLYITIIYY